MHLDGTKGRQLLRVLLQTAMINHSPLPRKLSNLSLDIFLRGQCMNFVPSYPVFQVTRLTLCHSSRVSKQFWRFAYRFQLLC